jgi:outer membrane protein assembly factor BamB
VLDKRNGNEIWRQGREEIDTWFTPLVVEVNGRAQVITGAMNRIVSYDLETGETVWHTAGLTMNPIPSPVAADGMVFLTSGYRGNSLKAIRLAGAKGDITGTDAVAWTFNRDTPYVPSPLLYDGLLYVLKSNNGILTVFDAKTGTPHYALQRLDAVPNVFASPVGAAGRVYITGREGDTVVLRNSPKFELLATNSLDDGFDASPALVDGEIYLRGYKSLYCISEK